jgi:uncharacterized protein YjbI with pentapeptide repeats
VNDTPLGSRWERQAVWLRLLIIVGAVAAFILAWVLIPPLLYRNVAGSDDARLKAITDTRTALLAGLVGVGALGTFWLNSRVYRITARTLQVTERGQVTDRYSKAIEQLGSATLDVRLGGIYALEQIAEESDRGEEDQVTITEVLSAFVRVHSDPFFQYKASWGKAAEGANTTVEEQRQKAAEYVAELDRPPVDVQAALTVLGRLPIRFLITSRWADLTRAWLLKADLRGANLTGARLREATLSGADLRGATLRDARLHGANLSKANLDGADLTEADLTHANLTGAWLSKATLIDVDFNKATLIDARLGEANLTRADFSESNLIKAAFFGANLTEANFEGANLTKATGLTVDQLNATDGDETTQLPAGLHHPERWRR